MMDVIYASPQFDKNYYIIDLFPREQMEIPSNMMEVWHRPEISYLWIKRIKIYN